MPVPASIPPELFKKVLEEYGYSVEDETEHSWALFSDNAINPLVILPKMGDVVAVDSMSKILDNIQMSNGEYDKILKKLKT